jgi:membrane associated rhomboid family serine protease
MSYPYRREISYSFGGPLTPAVKAIIIANCVVFLMQVLTRGLLTVWLALEPLKVLPFGFQIWRVATYMFAHGGVMHLLFNMLMLFIFGCSIERTWGTRSFYRYYFLCGLGAALFSFIPVPEFYAHPTIGASGAVYGILLAYAVLFPHNRIYIFLTLPVEARYVVMALGFIAFAGSLSGGDGIAHVVHLGGLVTGYALLRWVGIRRSSLGLGVGMGMGSGTRVGVFRYLRDAYRRHRMNRLRKKFEMYYQKRAEDGEGDQDQDRKPPTYH